MDIRRRFEENKHVQNPRLLDNLLSKADAELRMKKHPDPYIVPTAPGGSKVCDAFTIGNQPADFSQWERNSKPMIVKADPQFE